MKHLLLRPGANAISTTSTFLPSTSSFMKRIFSLALLAAGLGISAGHVSAQVSTPVYGNEWIESSRTYYKFKVAQKGLFRIQKSTLDAAGIPVGTAGSAFKMFRDGQQVPLWVSSGSSALGAGDYIEFYGTPANGKIETTLYASPAEQPNDRISMHNDTAAYFLTYDGAGTGHFRFAEVANTIPTNPGSPAAWCWGSSTVSYRNAWLPGRNLVGGCGVNEDHTMYSPQYETGEGFVNALMGATASHTVNLPTPGSVAAGVGALVYAGVIGSSYLNGGNLHNLQLQLNNTQIWDTVYGQDETKRIAAQASAGQLPAVSDLKFVNTPVGTCYFDRWGVSFAEIQYPRNFDAGNAGHFSFRLSPAVGQYLEFSNLAHNGSARLYDLTTRTVMTGVIAGSNVRFYLPASLSEREMLLVGGGASFIQNAALAKTIQFTNWAASAQQGDLIFVTHARLRQPVAGADQIAAYESYRESAAGGSHAVAVADVEDIYDQFGYGARMNPMAIRRFFQYAYDTWNPKPKTVFMIGHGLLYHQQKAYDQNPNAYNFPIVPTYGDPGADIPFVNWGPGGLQMMSIGRLSVRDAAGIKAYLDKVKAYEAAQVPAPMPTFQSESWKKSVLHIAGASDYNLQQVVLLPNLRFGEGYIEDTMTGYNVRTVAKNNTNPVDPITTPFVDSLMNAGMQLLTFHGHAGPAGFDYNINTPENYTNGAKSPVFLGLGCDVAQISDLQPNRTISERYIEHGGGGAIAMWAMNSISFTDWHGLYIQALYSAMASSSYGKNLGEQQRDANNTLLARYGWSLNNAIPAYRKLYGHNENFLLQGDPVVRVYSPERPDYHVGISGLSTLPTSISTALDSFRFRIITFNLGKASYDTAITVKVEHTNPQNVTATVASYDLKVLRYSDTTTVWIPINKSRDLGLNRYRVTIDAGDKYEEGSEANNTATIDVFIFSDDLVPVYPYKYSIVNTPQVTLKASSLNPFRQSGRYKIELDTTEKFNSPGKITTTINGPGGVIKWTPDVVLRDSTVYYWRTAFDSAIAGQYNWSTSSFVYLGGGSPGWNQSHYYQLATASRNRLDYTETGRRFDFERYLQKITIQSKIMDGSNEDVDSTRIRLNDVDLQRSHCPWSHAGAIQIMVVDSLTGKIWENDGSVVGAAQPNCSGQQHGRAVFVYEFPLTNATGRDNARKFLDSIPAGNFIIVKNSILGPPFNLYQPSPAASWKADTALPGAGSGKSLYHALKGMGFSQIDSYYKLQPFYFVGQKGVPGYAVQQEVGADSLVALTKDVVLPGKMASGNITSVEVGPAKEWKTLQWRSRAMDNQAQNDTVKISVYGLRASGVRQLLYSGRSRDTSLAWVSADSFPRLQLQWMSADTLNRSSAHLEFWRVLYTPLPEAALAPARLVSIADSLEVGQQQEVAVAIENISDQPMDSMLVSYKVVGANGASQTLTQKRYRPLPAGDTLHARLSFDPAAFVGKNLLLIEANPDNDQPEQYHPNNLGYLPFRIDKDERNPLVDVTFDGVHILDRDIVSAKPFIKVQLKDENRFLALDDTGLVQLFIRYPNDDLNVRRQVRFDGTTCKFMPATRKDDGSLDGGVLFGNLKKK